MLLFVNPFHANVLVGVSNEKMLFCLRFSWKMAKNNFRVESSKAALIYPNFCFFIFIFVSISQESVKNQSKFFVFTFSWKLVYNLTTEVNKSQQNVTTKSNNKSRTCFPPFFFYVLNFALISQKLVKNESNISFLRFENHENWYKT